MAASEGLSRTAGVLKVSTARILSTLLWLSICTEVVFGRRLRTNNSDCPSQCFCNPISKIVYCSRRGLTIIPRSIPSDSLQLNLNSNLFENSLITRSNLTTLASLEHLYLSECGIERIDVGAFQDLNNLKWLDLSNNRIARIEAFTFRGLSLMQLFLNGNRNLRLGTGSFADMQTTGLYLNECSLSKLTFDVLAPLNSTLQTLRLDANEFENIDKKFSTLFSSLIHVRLGQNPLHCNCGSLWLKEFYDTHGEIFKGAEAPSCLSPAKLRGKLFNEISLREFSCISPVFKNIDAVLENDRGILTCRATGDPAPTLYWVAPSGISTKYKPQREKTNYNEAILDISHHIQTGQDFSGQYFCLAINEGGNMTFTFNVSWPSYALPVTSLPSTSTRTTVRTTVNDPYIAIDRITRTHPDTDNDLDQDSHIYNIHNPPDGSSAKNKMAPGDTVNFSDNAQRESNETVKQIKTRGQFSLVELIGAIVGTFACTLLLCLIVIPILLKKTWGKKRQKSIEKPPLKEEPVYMAPVHNCNHYSGKLPQPYRSYSREYYFDNSSPMIDR